MDRRRPSGRLSIGGLCVLLGFLTGCDDPQTVAEPAAEAGQTAGATVDTGLRAVEHFLETWNRREAEAWADSLHFPHARPRASALRIWESRDEYVAEVDFERVIETGWERTVYEDLQAIHEADDKAHVAGRWARLDDEGNVLRRNQVTYVATRSDSGWGIQARFSAGAPISDEEAQPIAAAAVAQVEAYMEAFNARDPEAWAATLHYPHLRIASGEVQVWESAEELAAGMDFDAFAERFGWHHSAWDQVDPVQVAEGAANVALTFSRYNDRDEVLATFHTLYLVTRENGRWGIRARSSFAP